MSATAIKWQRGTDARGRTTYTGRDLAGKEWLIVKRPNVITYRPWHVSRLFPPFPFMTLRDAKAWCEKQSSGDE